jgi:hypothetical protein
VNSQYNQTNQGANNDKGGASLKGKLTSLEVLNHPIYSDLNIFTYRT